MRSNILRDGPTFISKSSMISSFDNCSIIGPVMCVKLMQYGWQSLTVRNFATSAVVQFSGSTEFNTSKGTVVLTSRGITLSSSLFTGRSCKTVFIVSVESWDTSVGVAVLCKVILIIKKYIYKKTWLDWHYVIQIRIGFEKLKLVSSIMSPFLCTHIQQNKGHI